MRKNLSFVVIIVLIFSCFSFVACGKTCEEHSYELIASKESTCVEKGYDLYQCVNCKEIKKEDKQLSVEHTYNTNATCVNRECIVVGCTHTEVATTEHEYSMKYICLGCNQSKQCTLEIIGQEYAEEMINQVSEWGFSTFGTLEIIILDANETIEKVKNEQNICFAYTDKKVFDENKIAKGLFVKLNSKETLGNDLYFNFGFEFVEEQTSDIIVFAKNTEEIWFLEVVDGCKTIVFEFSIL